MSWSWDLSILLPGGAGIFTNVLKCDLGDRIVYRKGLRGTFKSRDGIGENALRAPKGLNGKQMFYRAYTAVCNVAKGCSESAAKQGVFA